MKIAVLADIHGQTRYAEEARGRLRAADLVIIAGDITDFGGREAAGKVLREIAALNENILAVPGNCDRDGVQEELSARHMDLHDAVRIVDGTLFFGIGGCNTTHFHTPREYSEEEITTMLRKFPDPSGAERTVLVSHAPPHRTKLDRMFLGFHVGSRAVRAFIEDVQPDLVFCGHVHEALGADRIDRTLIINPGPFPKHYCVIEIGERLRFNLY